LLPLLLLFALVPAPDRALAVPRALPVADGAPARALVVPLELEPFGFLADDMVVSFSGHLSGDQSEGYVVLKYL
jgi:hypothetical protein